MSNLGIYVFSGTGNTMKCAGLLQKELQKLGIQAQLYNIEKDVDFKAGQDIVLCYPVHGFNAPGYMTRFCRNIPKGNGSIWFLKTSGEASSLNSNSSTRLAKVMTEKGYTVKGEFHFVMPYNMVFRHSDEMASLMWETARQRIPEAARQIAESKEKPVRSTFPAKLISGVCRIEHPFYPVNGRLFHVDSHRCLHCMKCVKACPTENISYDGSRFHFGGHCMECTRCSFECPAGAIHIGLLDFMRVNGKYDFNKDPEDAVIGRYCRKSYIRYFDNK